MRFLANGPSIPDELLVARDEGRVIFFCGAGVSRACAGLPGFFGLARDVIETLGVTADDPMRNVIKEVQDFDRRTGISGLVSADTVFGLLNRSFSVQDIQKAVAKALKPGLEVDLSAHRIILDLARGSNGKVRLVTTNFDLLFESCDNSLSKSRPPRLPDPRRFEEFKGIIHLHGHVDEDYKGADGDSFVLSSSEFGQAYISDGWATSFIKSVLEKYVVVFVGYTADDPPVRYLLEALNSYSVSLENVYAFQAGSPDEAEAKWRHKGARAIAYDEAEGHKALWDTLAAWASRARDPDAWYENVIALARKGPEALLPHERGQVVHIASTLNGAHKFSASDNPPPAGWLCVFDPLIRYSKPGYLGRFSERGPYFDPFDAYCLDSDLMPSKMDPNDYFTKRDVPNDVINCLALTRLDHKDLQDNDVAALRGHWSVNIPRLLPRLRQLGVWISKVSNQPAAVWWASGQAGIHPELQDQIRFELNRTPENCSAEVRKSWRYIFESWEKQRKDFDREWYLLKASIDLDGWAKAAIRELALMSQSYLKVKRPSWGGPKPPESKEGVRREDMVEIDLEYQAPDDDIEIPDQFIQVAVREFRKNLEHAVYVENELGKYRLDLLCPIEPDPDLEGESSERTYGISPSVLFYVSLMKRLIDKDPQAAKQEYLAWWTNEETVFTRLRIWASGYQRILSRIEAGRLLCSLSDESFWDGRHQRDLLLVLAKRWNDFPVTVKKRLERRLLRGPSRWESENPDEYPKRCAWLSLNRIHWLEAQGCKFTFDVNAESAKLRKAAPDWQIQYATRAAASMEGRAGSVRTDTGYSALLNEPLCTLLSRASEISGGEHELLVRKDPFAGLASERPVRAFLALVTSGKRNDYPEWAWRTFLYSEGRKKDKPKFTALIAERLARLSPSVIVEFVLPASDWLLKSSKILLSAYPGHYERVWANLILVLRSNKRTAESFSSQHNKESGWAIEALNSPVGKLAESLMDDPGKDQLGVGKGFPPTWIGRVEELLALEGDLRRHALVMFAFNLNWFFAIDPVWTEKNLISVLEQEGDDQNAVWDGLFWNAKVPSPKQLYMRIKPHLLNLARRKPVVPRRHSEVLSGILLAGWGSIDKKTGEPWITNAEMRDVLLDVDDDFRSHSLRYLERWPRQAGEWRPKSLAFLTAVWPRHNKVKSPRISARLCDLAFSDADNFSEMADAILPLVTKINQEHIVLHDLRRKNKGDIVDRFPEKLLALLHTVLPENASAWPYGIEATLDGIGAADPSLLNDARLIELKRQWNARR